MKNQDFIEKHSITGFSGKFGCAEVYKHRSGCLIVKKTARIYSQELYLSKEAAILWHLRQEGKGLDVRQFPRFFSCSHREAGTLAIITSIQEEYTGPTLHECHTRGYFVNPVKVITDILHATFYLQKCGVLHLDIEPNKLTLDLDAGVVKLTDFSHAQICDTPIAGIKETGKFLHTGEKLCSIDCENSSFGHAFNTKKLVPLAMAFGSKYMDSFHSHKRFRDATLLCAEALDIRSGLQLDSRVDVFSGALVVLSLMGGEAQITSDSTSFEAARMMTAFLSMVRGHLSESEGEILRYLLLNAGSKSQSRIYSESKRSAILHSLLHSSLRKTPGCKAVMAYVYGVPFTSTLCALSHPVQSLRASAEDGLKHLTKNHKPARPIVDSELSFRRRLSFISNQDKYGSCVFQGMLLEYIIVSIVVQGNDMFWCSVLPAFHTLGEKEQLTVCLTAARMLHSYCCSCTLGHDHACSWYLQLNRSSRIDIKINNRCDVVEKVLATHSI